MTIVRLGRFILVIVWHLLANPDTRPGSHARHLHQLGWVTPIEGRARAAVRCG